MTNNVFKKLEDKERKRINQLTLEATYKAQKKYGFKIGTGEHATWNNEADAFKHAYMQWYMTWHYGKLFANWAGNKHENETPNAPDYERNMDMWNNEVGREIAAEMKKQQKNKNIKWDSVPDEYYEEKAAKIIVDKMRKGELITDPFKDKRKYEEKNLNLKNRIFHKNEVTMEDLEKNPEMMEAFLDQAMEKDGLPTKAELDSRVASGGVIYVEEYTRSDGTKVSGYYRSC